jgi:hypothetical protein
MSPVIAKALGTENQHRNTATNLARTLYKELRANGCGTDEILAICTQMLDEVTSELKSDTSGVETSAA